MHLPCPRGSMSSALIAALHDDDAAALPRVIHPPTELLGDDDAQLALWICYELHYRGFDGVDDRWEWDPAVLGLRRTLEDGLLRELRRDVAVRRDDNAVADRLWRLVDGDDGPSLSRHIQLAADRRQALEFATLRSVYQLKEADPHMWAVPRLRGRAKAALVEIQADEYGAGDPSRMHSELFRRLLEDLGLDDSYGAYVDVAPGIALAVSNVMSLFGLRRELRGALVGHLAAYEMTSSAPCRRYAKGFRRIGASDEACAFYDAHVTADALHEQIAAHDMCGGLAEDEPALTEDIMFGAAACLHVERRFAEHVLGRWESGRSALRSGADVVGALATAS